MKRNQQFDILSSLCIFFVVLGHCSCTFLLDNWFIIYSFHMPLFFFISGYFYNNSQEKNLINTLWLKIKKFVIPYFIWNFFYMIFAMVLYKLNIMMFKPKLTLSNFFISPFIEGTQFYYNVASWFVLTLFLIQISYIIIRIILGKMRINNSVVLFLGLLGMGIIGVKLSYLGYRYGFYLVLIKVLYGLFFYNLGYLYKTKLEKVDKLNNISYFLIVFSLQFFVLIFSHGHTKVAVWEGVFNKLKEHSYTPFITAIPAIMFYLRLSRILVPSIGKSRVICTLSKNTGNIMYHHQFAFMLINIAFFYINKFYPLPDFTLYESNNPWYVYNFLHKNFSYVYVFYGLIIPIGIGIGVEKIKHTIKKYTFIK